MRFRVLSLLVASIVVVGGLGLWFVRSGSTRLDPVKASDSSVLAAENQRRSANHNASVREVSLTAAPTTVLIGDRNVSTWAFNGTVPGPEIRLTAGDVLRATVRNRLPAPLTIHWHGIALRNDMDGVPALTQEAIQPGADFTYEFTAPDPGTYFYHPHTGTQLDRGLYAPLIVEDPDAAKRYDREVTLLLDDWTDGYGESPDEIFERLRAGMGQMETAEHDMSSMSGMGDEMQEEQKEGSLGTQEGPLGDDTGDVQYPLYLVNGKTPANPAVFDAKPGERVLLRLINAGSDTPFRVALGGRSLNVTATDGFPVQPVAADAILLGMGERYDAIVDIGAAGIVPLVALAEGKNAQALAVLRSGPGNMPMQDVRPAELNGKLLSLSDLRPAPEVALPPKASDRTYQIRLSGDMTSYRWSVEGPKEGGVTLPVRRGERIRLVFENQTMMWHPMHLHGHTFQVFDGGAGPRKDTVIVPAMGRATVEFVANNPGQWALHCHNIYHAEAGMVTVVSYVR